MNPQKQQARPKRSRSPDDAVPTGADEAAIQSFISKVNVAEIDKEPEEMAVLVPQSLRRPGLPWQCVLSISAAAVALCAMHDDPTTPTGTMDDLLTAFTAWLLQRQTPPREAAQLLATTGDADAPTTPDAVPGDAGLTSARHWLRLLDPRLRWAAPDAWLIGRVVGPLRDLRHHAAQWSGGGTCPLTVWLRRTALGGYSEEEEEEEEEFPLPDGQLDDVDLAHTHGLLPYGRLLAERESQLSGYLAKSASLPLRDVVWGVWRQFYVEKGTAEGFWQQTMGISKPNTVPCPWACAPDELRPLQLGGGQYMYIGDFSDAIARRALVFAFQGRMQRINQHCESSRVTDVADVASDVEYDWERLPMQLFQSSGGFSDFAESFGSRRPVDIFANLRAAPAQAHDARPTYQASEGGDVRVGVVRTVGHLLKDCLGKGRDKGHVGNIVMAANGGLGKTRVAEDLRRAALLRGRPSSAPDARSDVQVVCDEWDTVLRENGLEHVVVLFVTFNNRTGVEEGGTDPMQAVVWRAALDAVFQRECADDNARLDPPQRVGDLSPVLEALGLATLEDVVGAARRDACPHAPEKVLVVVAIDGLKFRADCDRRVVLESVAELQHAHLGLGVPTVCFVTALKIEPVANVWVSESQRALIAVRLPTLSLKASVALLCDVRGLVEPSLDELRVLHFAAALASGHPRILKEIIAHAPLTFKAVVPPHLIVNHDDATAADEVSCLLDCIHNPDCHRSAHVLTDTQQRLINRGVIMVCSTDITTCDFEQVTCHFRVVLGGAWGRLRRNNNRCLSAYLVNGLLSVMPEGQEEDWKPAPIAAVVLSAAKQRSLDDHAAVSLLDLCFPNPEQDVNATTATRALATVKMDVRMWRSFARNECVVEKNALDDRAILRTARGMAKNHTPSMKLWVSLNRQERGADCVLIMYYENTRTWNVCVCFTKTEQPHATSGTRPSSMEAGIQRSSMEVGTVLWARMDQFRRQLRKSDRDIVLTAAILFTARLDGNAVSAQPITVRSARVQDEIVCVDRAACLELFKPYGFSPLLLTSAT